MKRIRIQALYLKSLVVYLLAVLFIILIVIHSEETIAAVRSALGLCYPVSYTHLTLPTNREV